MSTPAVIDFRAGGGGIGLTGSGRGAGLSRTVPEARRRCGAVAEGGQVPVRRQGSSLQGCLGCCQAVLQGREVRGRRAAVIRGHGAEGVREVAFTRSAHRSEVGLAAGVSLRANSRPLSGQGRRMNPRASSRSHIRVTDGPAAPRRWARARLRCRADGRPGASGGAVKWAPGPPWWLDRRSPTRCSGARRWPADCTASWSMPGGACGGYGHLRNLRVADCGRLECSCASRWNRPVGIPPDAADRLPPRRIRTGIQHPGREVVQRTGSWCNFCAPSRVDGPPYGRPRPRGRP